MGSGLFPLDERWGLKRGVYRAGLACDMVWLSGLPPYEQASTVFARIAGRLVPAAAWRNTLQGD